MVTVWREAALVVEVLRADGVDVEGREGGTETTVYGRAMAEGDG